MIQWGWCLAVLVIECILVTDPRLTNLWTGQYALGSVLMLSLGFSASGSVRKEKETGALELLLPLTVCLWVAPGPDVFQGLRAMVCCQLASGLAAWIFLQMNLQRRRFVLTKA